MNATLSKGRKKREISKALATPEDLGSMALLSSAPLHKTTLVGATAWGWHFCAWDTFPGSAFWGLAVIAPTLFRACRDSFFAWLHVGCFTVFIFFA